MKAFWPNSPLTITVNELLTALQLYDGELPVVLTWEGQCIELRRADLSVDRAGVEGATECLFIDADNLK